MAIALYFFFGEFGAIHWAPHVSDVGEHKGHQYGHHAHHLEGELARTAVADSERAIGVEQRGIVGGVVVAQDAEEHYHHGHHTDGRPANAFGSRSFAHERFSNAPKHGTHAGQ